MSGDDSTRRQVLGVLGSGALVGLAGCTGPGGSDTEATCADGAQARSAPRGLSAVDEESLPIPDEELVQAALPEDIPAIIDPAFGDDWTGIETTHETYEGTSVISRPRLTDADPIIGVVQEGQGRAYPLRVLASHEVVNDRFGGPIVVTYCSLCASSVVASRVVAGEELSFRVSGLLWKNNLVLEDEQTRSLWSQITATAIQGPKTGDLLEMVPTTLSTWGTWQENHPNTDVLLPPPASGTLFEEYLDTTAVYEQSPEPHRADRAAEAFDQGSLTKVLGVTIGGTAKAYPMPEIIRNGVINDAVAGVPLVIAVGPGRTLIAYQRPDSSHTFEQVDRVRMRGAGSTWKINTGEAVDGDLKGQTLCRVSDIAPMFWKAWQDFHTDTKVFGDWTPE